MIASQNLVVVVDDDPAVRESLKFALETEGFCVDACASGPELLGHPDLDRARCLVVDYQMPGMNGLEVLGRLAARGNPPPSILMTGHSGAALLRRRAAAAGARCVLEKPMLDQRLVDGIRAILAEPH